MEREKLDLLERNAKSEEELRDSFAADRAKLTDKIDKLKKQLADKDDTIDTANKKVSDLEKELIIFKKENDSLFTKIAELSKEASEKLDQVKTVEVKHRTAEKENNTKIKELKHRNREKIAELQKKYDETLQEKLKLLGIEFKAK